MTPAASTPGARRLVLCLALMLPLVAVTAARSVAETETADLNAIDRIRHEALSRSEVMRIAAVLTDAYGPRVSGSPQLREAAEWSVGRLKGWGIDDARVENWGVFGWGWVNERFTAHAFTPRPWPLVGLPKAFTPGTGSAVMAPAVYAPLSKEEDFARFRGRLRGRIVLPIEARELDALFDPPARRFSDEELERLSRGERERVDRAAVGAKVAFARKRLRFLIDEGALAVLEPSRGNAGELFVQHGGALDAHRNPSLAGASSRPEPVQVVVTAEHYGRMARLLATGQPVQVELDIRNRFLENQPGLNVIAEIPGTDLADEVVMLGAHLDAWHGGTGATDNAVGVAVLMEVMRILKASDLPLRRTVRLALWSGEEQGLLGSRAYVRAAFADPETMARTEAHSKISVYFNLDNGTGAIRGVYLQGNQAAAPIFSAWFRALDDESLSTLSPMSTFSSDHLSFDEVGIPAFQFIQDPIEYHTRTHHSSFDTLERIQPQDAVRNAVIVAALAYHAANREERLPRKALPMPRGRQPVAGR